MEIKLAIKRQYHASLAMLKEAVEICPDDLWLSGDEGRGFWRIAYHTLFYTHLYLMPEERHFRPWDKAQKDCASLWGGGEEVLPHSKEEILEYWAQLDASIDNGVDALDLSSSETGFDWYSMPKLDHQLMNLRHVQHHVGQLSERLIAAGVDVKWNGGQVKK